MVKLENEMCLYHPVYLCYNVDRINFLDVSRY
jgi:hypothetical protein